MFKGFEFKEVEFSVFIDDKESLKMTDGGIVTSSVSNFSNKWDEELEKMNELLNEAFKSLIKEHKNGK